VRTRLSRRDTREASVPLPDGGFLYAQLDFTHPQEVRSDLYVERDGRARRLTRGQRLIQPDVNARGEIVAVKLGPGRSSLVLVSKDGRTISTLGPAGYDEVWAEPRWSPDGSRVIVAHRAPGGLYDIRIVDVATLDSYPIRQGRYLLTSPTWSRSG
jgi:hypothetical protein